MGIFSNYKDTPQQKEDIQKFKKIIKENILPNTEFGTKFRFLRVPKNENNYLAFVYGFAALLVVVLGLRGLGTQISQVLPDWLVQIITDSSGRLHTRIIFVALLAEFLMILLLAITMFFKLEEHESLFSLVEDIISNKHKAISKTLLPEDFERIADEIMDLSNQNKELCSEIIKKITKLIDLRFEENTTRKEIKDILPTK
jgi:hypothetical protein